MLFVAVDGNFYLSKVGEYYLRKALGLLDGELRCANLRSPEWIFRKLDQSTLTARKSALSSADMRAITRIWGYVSLDEVFKPSGRTIEEILNQRPRLRLIKNPDTDGVE
jgi:hypothetical protein